MIITIITTTAAAAAAAAINVTANESAACREDSCFELCWSLRLASRVSAGVETCPAERTTSGAVCSSSCSPGSTCFASLAAADSAVVATVDSGSFD